MTVNQTFGDYELNTAETDGESLTIRHIPTGNDVVIDSGGVARDKVGCHVEISSQQTVSSGVETTMLIDTAEFDHYEWLDAANNRIVVDSAGLYELHGHAHLTAATGSTQLDLRVKVNGSTVVRADTTTSSGNDATADAARYLTLAVGDIVTLTLEHTSASDETFTSEAGGNFVSVAKF